MSITQIYFRLVVSAIPCLDRKQPAGFLKRKAMKTIQLTQNKISLIDDGDYSGLSKYKWYAVLSRNKNWYAVRYFKIDNKYASISMHRQILGLQKGDKREVDHKDHDGLNNQRYNLRVCTHQENDFNRKYQPHSSKFKGVNLTKGKYMARIKLNGKKLYIGLYENEIEAARAYDEKAKELHGEYAGLNFKM